MHNANAYTSRSAFLDRQPGGHEVPGSDPIKAVIISIVGSVCIVNAMNSEFIALIADKLSLQLKSSEVANF